MKFPYYFPRALRPSVYQGKRTPENYFEGWYFKLVNPGEDKVWSIIAGVSYSNDPHAFIQVIEAVNGNTHYFRFPLDAFRFSKDRFEISIGHNYFSEDYLKLDIADELISIKGQIDFTGISYFPQKLLAPGIMGWYSFVPRMECYHGVVSMHHMLKGELLINNNPVAFTGGKGYIEKDWGTSMPSDWVWMQSNHFRDHETASFMLSVARIPWRKGFFPGFLSFLYADGKVYRFATYNQSKITAISINKKEVHIKLLNRKHQLNIVATPNKAGKLKAPRHGSMDREIFESLNSSLEIKLTTRQDKILFSSIGAHAGLEIVGNVAQYFI